MTTQTTRFGGLADPGTGVAGPPAKESLSMPVTEIGVHLPNLVGATARPGDDEIVVKGKPSAFAELIDIANPLQHVPLASDLYRAATGDRISDGAKLGGHVAIGAVAGGPVGALIGAGVFLLEKLFGGGGPKPTEHVGLSVRSQDRAVAEALLATGSERPAGAAAQQLSSAEFAALLASFQTAKAGRHEVRDEDVASRMRANLDKLDAMQGRD
jgi:hypothetical protein